MLKNLFNAKTQLQMYRILLKDHQSNDGFLELVQFEKSLRDFLGAKNAYASKEVSWQKRGMRSAQGNNGNVIVFCVPALIKEIEAAFRSSIKGIYPAAPTDILGYSGRPPRP